MPYYLGTSGTTDFCSHDSHVMWMSMDVPYLKWAIQVGAWENLLRRLNVQGRFLRF